MEKALRDRLMVTEHFVKKPVAFVITVHGMCEHQKRYFPFIEKLNEENYNVVSYNHRFHGEGYKDTLGLVDTPEYFSSLLADLKELVTEYKTKFPELKLFLFGHSMGSFITTRFIELYGKMVDGAMLSGSTDVTHKHVFDLGLCKSIMRRKGPLHVSNYINMLPFKNYNKRTKRRTIFDWHTTDKVEVEKFIVDPYCGFPFSISFYVSFLTLFNKIKEGYQLINRNLPIYILSGLEDPVGLYGTGIKRLIKRFKKMGMNDLSYDLYEGKRHELLEETNKEEVITNVLKFLADHK